ncbi:DUF3459 domain-containing protein, partial [Methylobacterium hispanicum]
ALRREHDALAVGSYRTIALGLPDILAYERGAGEARLRVILNFGTAAHEIPLPENEAWTILLSSRGGRAGERGAGRIRLGGAEGLILMQS